MVEAEMARNPDSSVGERLKFGEFELAPVARILWRRGEQVRLGSRALDILSALASRTGHILSKDDLTKLVWRGAVVDETALRVGISAVRKALRQEIGIVEAGKWLELIDCIGDSQMHEECFGHVQSACFGLDHVPLLRGESK